MLLISVLTLGVLSLVLIRIPMTSAINTGVSVSGRPKIGGPFRLTTHEGKLLTDRDLRGTPYVAFFGFTHCPDVCPTALWNLSELLKSLGPDGDKLKVLLISVDAERDTPELLTRYLQSFDPRIVGLTGSEAEIAETASAFRAFVRKVPVEGGGFTFDHTATIYLMDRKGEFFSALDLHETEETRFAKVRRLIKEG
jgi:protein SCO1/2